MKVIIFFSLGILYPAWCFIELYETEHAQQQLAEEISELSIIAKAKQLIDKMKDGFGGTTIAIHHPSNRRFIHRNGWIFTCNGQVSKENGHCNGDPTESLAAFKPERPSDFCFIKNYNVINETLCLSSHPVKLTYENNTIVCEATMKFFPTLVIEIEDYLKLCDGISSNTTYIYYANQDDPDHVQVPNENPRVKCDNEYLNGTVRSSVTARILKEYSFSVNRTSICVFTEQDKLVLKLLEYLQL
ncbi:uncharacterized protein LOC143201292 [Rhynchophorus ferrugineus]|uniref:Uncharacterized protein n=1 Tax=Rhynchophorus ferrugineus TaxID=354439 RepID=A0A834IB16_RHYFE|nr:hypothetical protein GWI33_009116 [Rhynchophorus ferrugineus]